MVERGSQHPVMSRVAAGFFSVPRPLRRLDFRPSRLHSTGQILHGHPGDLPAHPDAVVRPAVLRVDLGRVC